MGHFRADNMSVMPAIPKPTSAAADNQHKLERLKSAHFTPEGRDERIARSLRMLKGPKPGFNLSSDTWKQIAEDSDLEDT